MLDLGNKVAYRQALDLQIAEKEKVKFESERVRKRDELDSLSNYPFGRRIDYTVPTYQPSFQTNNDTLPPARLNKDLIIQKPNSIHADVPPYGNL